LAVAGGVNPAGAVPGAPVTGCGSLIAGVAAAGGRSAANSATADPGDDEFLDMLIPVTTSTSTALATTAMTTPCAPDSTPATRGVQRRVVGPYPGSVTGAKSGSLSWVRPVMGLTGRSVSGAAGGFELVTGWNRSTICGAGPGSPEDGCGFTAALNLPCGYTGHGHHTLLSVSSRLPFSHATRSVSRYRYGKGSDTVCADRRLRLRSGSGPRSRRLRLRSGSGPRSRRSQPAPQLPPRQLHPAPPPAGGGIAATRWPSTPPASASAKAPVPATPTIMMSAGRPCRGPARRRRRRSHPPPESVAQYPVDRGLGS
jgi:hypothetical protein